MACVKETICKLCHILISDKNFEVIESATRDILDVVQLKLNFDGQQDHVMCSSCSGKLQAAFDFKSKCSLTNNTIIPYAYFHKPIPVDLREIYMIEQGINLADNQMICRLCLQIAGDEFTLAQEVEGDVFQNYIPEVNFSMTKDPIICKLCMDNLNAHSYFMKKCLNADKKVNILSEGEITNNKSDFASSDLCIKSQGNEEQEETKMIIDIEETKLKFARLVEKEIEEELIKTEKIIIKSEDMEDAGSHLSQQTTCENATERKISIMKNEQHGDKPDIQWHQCNFCNYKSKRAKYLKRHMLIHRNFSEIKWHQCEICSYKSKRRNDLNTHMLTHKDNLEIKWHRCDICDYKSKMNKNLKRHMLIHRDYSEIKWRQCEICSYKSKRKDILNTHMLTHKDRSEMKWHLCDICDYKTKQKQCLKVHMLIHTDHREIKWHQCGICEFKSKYKNGLKTHMLTHRDHSEIEWHRCAICSYKSKQRAGLNSHMLIHRDYSKIKWHHCEICSYKSKRKGDLNGHMLTHKDHSEMQWCKCDMCDHKFKMKCELDEHMLIHSDISETASAKRDIYDFKAKLKSRFETVCSSLNHSQESIVHEKTSETN